jgi:hypothetical protein
MDDIESPEIVIAGVRFREKRPASLLGQDVNFHRNSVELTGEE